MRKNYLYLLIIILFGLNIFLLYHIRVTKSFFIKVCSSYEHAHQNDSIQLDNLKKLINYNYLGKINVPDSLQEYFKNNEKLILYFTEGNCSPCIEECLLYFDQICKSIGKDNILMLGNFRNKKAFEVYAENTSVFIENSQFCKDIGLPKELNNQPVIFIMDGEMKIRLLYVPDFFPEYMVEYFTKIIPRYFK